MHIRDRIKNYMLPFLSVLGETGTQNSSTILNELTFYGRADRASTAVPLFLCENTRAVQETSHHQNSKVKHPLYMYPVVRPSMSRRSWPMIEIINGRASAPMFGRG
jgi:hypothetical protein